MSSYNRGGDSFDDDYRKRATEQVGTVDDTRGMGDRVNGDGDDRRNDVTDRPVVYDMADDALDAPEYSEIAPAVLGWHEGMDKDAERGKRKLGMFDDQFESVKYRDRPEMQNNLHQMLESYIDTQFKEEENENYKMIDKDVFSLAHMGLAFYVEQFSAETIGQTKQTDKEAGISCLVKIFLDSNRNLKAQAKLNKNSKYLAYKISPKDSVAMVNQEKRILAKGQLKYFEENYAVVEFPDESSTSFSSLAKKGEEVALLKNHNFITRDRCISLSNTFERLKSNTNAKNLFSFICHVVVDGLHTLPVKDSAVEHTPTQISKFLSTTPLDKFTRLNSSQKDAVIKSYTCDWFNIIHGPPGTGKSECLTILLEVMAREGKRVLICAESNKPVDNLLAKFAKTSIFESMKDNWTIIRLGDKLRVDKSWKRLLLKYKLERAVKIQEKSYRGKKRRRGENSRFDPVTEILIKQLGNIAGQNKNELKKNILLKSQLVFSTQCSIFDEITLAAFSERQFDYAIIDEASQSFSGQTLMAIAVSKRVIFAGDHKQLPPCIIDRGQPHLAESLFEMLMTRLDEKPQVKASYYTMLNVQYRMNHKLMTVSNSRYYDNKVQSGNGNREIILTNLESTRAGTTNILPKDIPLVWLDHKCQEDGRNPRSITNPGEVKIVISLLDEVINQLHIPADEVGVIVSLKAQQLLIIDKLGKHHSLKKHVGREGQLAIATVDSFQGLEKEVIIYASVRSNDKGNIGFLSDERRFNVACTRAKRLLVFVGNSQCLLKAQPKGCFRDLLDYAGRAGKVLFFQDKFAEDSNKYPNSFSDFTLHEPPVSETKTAIPVSEIKNRHKGYGALQDEADRRLFEAIRLYARLATTETFAIDQVDDSSSSMSNDDVESSGSLVSWEMDSESSEDTHDSTVLKPEINDTNNDSEFLIKAPIDHQKGKRSRRNRGREKKNNDYNMIHKDNAGQIRANIDHTVTGQTITKSSDY